MKALGKGSIAWYLKILLDVIWVVLWVAAAGLALVVVLYVGGSILIGLDKITAESAGTNLLERDLSWTMAAPALLGAVIAIAAGLLITGRLKKLFANFCSEKPFLMENADHLRVIWITLLVLEVSRYVVAGLVGAAVTMFGAPKASELSITFQLKLETWFAIFTLMVLAEVFRIGARMREEQDLTI